jgi:hypothetical protein
MLTSPVNVTIAAANGIALKANSAASDHNTRREPPHPASHQALPVETVIEPEARSNSPLTNVNAVAATVGNRTILQEFTLNVARMLKLARRPDENLTSLFLRIIATIEAMPQAERLQFESRAGFKPLKITLADLVMALRKPDGQEAARLTAIAEAPAAVPGRTAANAATTTYLEEGTNNGHTEETLAMRAAARHSAAGQSVFSAESKVRPADAQPADAKMLQNHLKAMFEPGGTGRTDERNDAGGPIDDMVAASGGGADQGRLPIEGKIRSAAAEIPDVAVVPNHPEAMFTSSETDRAAPQSNAGAEDIAGEKWPVAEHHEDVGGMDAVPAARDEARPNLRQPATPASGHTGEDVTFSSTNLNLDQSTVEKIRNVAQAIANLAETVRADQQRPASEKVEDRRLQTMLTLKGLAEVVTAIPARAAELLAIMVAEAAAPLPEPANGKDRLATEAFGPAVGGEHPAELVPTSDKAAAEDGFTRASTEEMPGEIPTESSAPAVEHPEAETDAVTADEHRAVTDFESMPPARQDLTQHAVPFVHAQVQPAREDMIAAVEEEEDAREETDEDGEDEDGEDGEKRRPRDEYDAIHDPLPEEDPAIVINRDSSEADRAFALYQRMGGF